MHGRCPFHCYTACEIDLLLYICVDVGGFAQALQNELSGGEGGGDSTSEEKAKDKEGDKRTHPPEEDPEEKKK